MKLENQVVSLDLSKRLKELGFNQESEFYYADNEDGELLLVFDNGTESHPIMAHLGEFEEEDSINIPAYTVAELGEMLPIGTEIIKYSDVYTVLSEGQLDDKNLANAIAKMLIYLKENNLI